MKIKKIKVLNHSRIKDFQIEVRNNLVLVGCNGSGKSSILRCLNLVLGCSKQQLNYQISESDFSKVEEPLIIEIEIGDLSDVIENNFYDSIIFSGDNEKRIKITLEAIVNEDEIEINRYATSSGGNKRYLYGRDVFLIGWSLISNGSTEGLSKNNTVKKLLSNLNIESNKETISTIVDDLCDALDNSEELNNLKSNLTSKLTHVTNVGIHSTSDLRFIPGSKVDDSLLSDVRLLISDMRGEKREIAHQSDGMKCIISHVIALAISGEEEIIAVDEPEVHLHPSSQRCLVELLKTESNQLILATHSAIIVKMFDPEDIAIVHSDGTITQVQRNSMEIGIKKLASYWLNEHVGLFTANKIIAVEGISDAIVVKAVAKKLGIDLNLLGVEILVINGFDEWKAVRTFFGKTGFDIPCYFLLDIDKNNKNEIIASQLQISIDSLNASNFFFSDPELEREYIRAFGVQNLYSGLKETHYLTDNELKDKQYNASTISENDLYDICKKHKVECALAVSDLLSPDIANKISSVSSIVEKVAND